MSRRSQAQASEPPLVHTVSEAADLLRISRQSAYEAVRRGEIPTLTVGKRILVPRHALMEMLQRAGIKPEPPKARKR